MSKNVTIFDITMAEEKLSKRKAREIKGLSIKKNRDQEGLFLVEGEKCVIDTFDGFEIVNLICTQSWKEGHKDIIKRFQDKLLISDLETIKIVSTLSTPPDVIGLFRKPEDNSIESALNEDNFYVLLDEIQDPGNLGTIIRTCDWFGVYNVYASHNTADIYAPKVVQATMGSLKRVKVKYTDLETLIDRNDNLPLIGTVLNGRPLNELKVPKGAMILLGNEGRGISEKLRRRIDIPVTIPPTNNIEHPDSLNVGIANAIVLSYIRNQ